MISMIQTGAINSTTMVWRQGLATWIPAGGAPELHFAFDGSFAAPVNPNAKSKMAAGLLGIFLGSWGVHRFYLGYTGIGIAQIAVTICTCGVGGIGASSRESSS